MRKFFIILLTLVMLTGCGQLEDNPSEEPLNMPKIVFLERVYNDSDGFINIAFTDSNGDCYASVEKEVCGLGFSELVDKYKSDGLDGKITKTGSRSPEELQSNYEKLCNAVRQDDCDIVYPDSLPDVVADSYSWYGLYYNENGEFKSQVIQENECETGLDSNSDAINEIYKWYAGNYIAVDE